MYRWNQNRLDRKHAELLETAASGRSVTAGDEGWRAWAAARPPSRHLHLDSGAAGRMSTGVIDAVRRHLVDEAELGAYVAAQAAEPLLDAARATVGELVGLAADDVAFVESASAGRTALLAAWPFGDGDAVAVAPSEWGPNVAAFRHRGLSLRQLAVDRVGAIDLDALAAVLHDDPPALVHVTPVASHRPLVQPLAAIVERCCGAGVPVWVDAAQALGHVDVSCGADAVYGTSRKWLTGPRGVGVVAVAERHWPDVADAPSGVRSARRPGGPPPGIARGECGGTSRLRHRSRRARHARSGGGAPSASPRSVV